MGIGNLGISEILIITVIVLVFFGPARLPEIARSVGSAMRDFKRSLNDLQRELEESGSRPDGDRPRHRPGPRAGEPVLPSGEREAGEEEERGSPPAGTDAPAGTDTPPEPPEPPDSGARTERPTRPGAHAEGDRDDAGSGGGSSGEREG